MNLKLKYPSESGIIRLENSVYIKEVMVQEDFLHPGKERISIGFMNKNSSGLIEFNFEEFDRLMKSAKDKINLVKKVKIFKG